MNPNEPSKTVPNTDEVARLTSALETSRQNLGQRIAAQPDPFKQYAPENDATVQGLRANQADKVKQLFEFDSQVAQRTYQPMEAPGPQPEGYTAPSPRILDPSIGLIASSEQKQATAGELSDIINQIAVRKDTLATERDKALSSIDKLIQINKQEQDSIEKQLTMIFKQREDKRAEEELGLKRLTAGYGGGIKEKQAVDSVRADVQSGAKFNDLLVKYSLQIARGDLSIAQIEQEYNQGPMATKWGKPRETEQEKMDLITGAKKGPTKLTAERERLKINAGSALKDLDSLEKKINSDSSVLWKAEIPGGLGVRDYLTARNNVMDVISRLRTGVAKRKEEDAFYKSFVPTIGDSPQEIQSKIQRLKKYYSAFMSGTEVFGLTPDMIESSQNIDNSSGGEWK